MLINAWQLTGKTTWFTVFALLLGTNTPIMDDFKLLHNITECSTEKINAQLALASRIDTRVNMTHES